MHEKSEQPGNWVSNCKLPIDETTSMILEFYGAAGNFIREHDSDAFYVIFHV